MNQFVFTHSLKPTARVNQAVQNELFDLGIFPIPEAYNFGVIDIDVKTKAIKFVRFTSEANINRENLTRYIQKNPSHCMIVFNSYKDKAKDFSQMVTITDDKENCTYGILGIVNIDDPRKYKSVFEAHGIELAQYDNINMTKELFLADFILLDSERTSKLINPASKADFIILKYDTNGKEHTISKIIIGSNNDNLRISGNGKFFTVTNTWGDSVVKDRRLQRGGKIMAGNVVQIDFDVTGEPKFEVYYPLFMNNVRTDIMKRNNIITAKDVRIFDDVGRGGLRVYDEKNNCFVSALQVAELANHELGFHGYNRNKNLDKWLDGPGREVKRIMDSRNSPPVHSSSWIKEAVKPEDRVELEVIRKKIL